MKYVVILIVLALIALLLYKASVAEPVHRTKRMQAEGVVSNVVRSGRRVGEGAGKAFEGVDFGGSR
ncbi:MAG: hypothetical protein ACYS8K_02140 [Planctomycetota bacterium]|jgi:hypothetical protein